MGDQRCYLLSNLHKYTKTTGIFNWSTDHTRLKNILKQVAWSSVQHSIIVNQLKLLYSLRVPYQKKCILGMQQF